MDSYTDQEAASIATRWGLARITLVFLGLRSLLRFWADAAPMDTEGTAQGPLPYLLWSAHEHTSRTALAWTLLVWAILPGSHLPPEGDAQND